jgi:hypothetical protein
MTLLCISAAWWDAIADTGTALATICLVAVAYKQLSKFNESFKVSLNANRISNLMNVLENEAEISRRKSFLNEIVFEIEEYGLTNKPSLERIAILERKLNSAIEDYLNSIDRLAYCIDKGYFPEKDWKREYRRVIENVVQTYSDWLGVNSIYVNLIDLSNRWRRE